MTLGRRCDEIVRIIEETLSSVVPDPGPSVDVSAHPSAAGHRDRGRRSTGEVGATPVPPTLSLLPGGLTGGAEPGPDPGGRDRRRRRAGARLRTLHDLGATDW